MRNRKVIFIFLLLNACGFILAGSFIAPAQMPNTTVRMAVATDGRNSDGTGIQTTNPTAQFDDTSPISIAEGNFGNPRMSTNRNLYMTIRDAAGNERGVNVNASNGLLIDLGQVGGTATAAAAALADNTANPTVGSFGSYLHIFDGTTWDRLRDASTAAGSTTGAGITAVFNLAYDGTTYVAHRAATIDALGGGNAPYVVPGTWNGANVDRTRGADLSTLDVSTTLTARNSIGAQLMEKGGRWSVISNPAAGSQASASIAAEASVRHVADCIAFSSGSTTAPALTALTVNLRDGATGAGTVIWTYQVVIEAATGKNTESHSVCGLSLVGTTNTAMTLEFSASLANLIQAVSISGYNVN